jgi:hypothetical protein
MKPALRNPSARLLRDLGVHAVRDEHGRVGLLPETETPTRTLLDRSFGPGGPTIRELTDAVGRGRPKREAP